MQTTIRCTFDEKDTVEKTAFKNGTDVSRFITHALKKHLPIQKAPIFDKSINRSIHRLGIIMPTKVSDEIEENIKNLSTDFKRVFKWEVILFCALKECKE